MQKVVGSSPIIRSENPLETAGFLLAYHADSAVTGPSASGFASVSLSPARPGVFSGAATVGASSAKGSSGASFDHRSFDGSEEAVARDDGRGKA